MIGYPYTYGDDLSIENSILNVKELIRDYGLLLIFLTISSLPAYGVDPKNPHGLKQPEWIRQSDIIYPDNKKSPLMKPILPLSRFMKSKVNGFLFLFSSIYITMTAASGGNPILITASFLILAYILGVKFE